MSQRNVQVLIGRLLTDEAVFHDQAIVGKGSLVEEVPKPSVEGLVLVVTHLEQAVFDAKGVRDVVAERMAGDLRRPSVEIAAVEQRDPFLFAGRGRFRRGSARRQCGKNENKTARARGATGIRSHVSVLSSCGAALPRSRAWQTDDPW